jgi:uncharacterized protein (TIGR04255 family)
MSMFKSPDFPNAPLIEVALSVQFQPLVLFASAHAGLFWQQVRDLFPISQDQPALPMLNELFGSNRPNVGFVGMGFQFAHPPNRTWFSSQDGALLIQIQHNRFVFNWRKASADSVYPRYEFVRSNFEKYFNLFKSFVAEHNLGQLSPDLYEAHYVNQWPLEDGKNFGEVIGSWLKLFSGNVTSLEPEQASISSQYIIHGNANQPVGRLYVNVAPIINTTGKYGVNLELICRTIPFDLGPNFDLAPLDLAREKVVTTFQQITSDSAHQFWRGQA